jgi:methylase of polypeptide subunit release factors
MLSTDDIFLLATALSADGGFAGALSEQLRALHASPSYQGWLGTLAEAEPFVLPNWTDDPLLGEARLARSGRLLVKLNRTGEAVFLTDGVWVEPRVRVFPFCDESAALVSFVRKTGLARGADWTLDLATGCGVNAMTIGGRSLACDINPRALAYAAANRTLNRILGEDCVLALNDIRDGIPKALGAGLDGHVLILANMPFGPAPSPEALPLTSNGGETGADLQIATYRAVADLVRSAEGRFSFTACLMGLTVGDRATDRWDIVDHAIRHFGADRVRWHLLREEHVFRIDGVRQFGNPAPVAIAFPGLASCRLYTPNERERTAKIAAFTELARRHETRGNPDIAYGIVEIVGTR